VRVGDLVIERCLVRNTFSKHKEMLYQREAPQQLLTTYLLPPVELSADIRELSNGSALSCCFAVALFFY
jgi:hypothetical protein